MKADISKTIKLTSDDVTMLVKLSKDNGMSESGMVRTLIRMGYALHKSKRFLNVIHDLLIPTKNKSLFEDDNDE